MSVDWFQSCQNRWAQTRSEAREAVQLRAPLLRWVT